MAENGAYMNDVRLLEELNATIKQSGKRMADIEQNVSSYLNSVKGDLNKHLDYLRQKLEEAQERLNQAEQALSTCHACQVFVPEVGVVPTCIPEEAAVASARADVAECQRKYTEGQHIVSECQREIADYSGPGGGKELILNMANNQTPKAMELLSNCIQKLEDVFASDVVDNRNDYGVQPKGNVSESAQTVSSNVHLDAFRKNIQGKKY